MLPLSKISIRVHKDIWERPYLSTTTTGLSVLVTIISVFHIMSAEHMIIPKFKPWSKNYIMLENYYCTSSYLPNSHLPYLINRVSDYIHF